MAYPMRPQAGPIQSRSGADNVPYQAYGAARREMSEQRSTTEPYYPPARQASLRNGHRPGQSNARDYSYGFDNSQYDQYQSDAMSAGRHGQALRTPTTNPPAYLNIPSSRSNMHVIDMAHLQQNGFPAPAYGATQSPLSPTSPLPFTPGMTPLGQMTGSYFVGAERREYRAQRERLLQKREVRHVELQQGNLVLDCAVPQQIIRDAPFRTDRSVTHMRYTAVTCDPDDFATSKYCLRPYLAQQHTEMAIVMTMYNEDEQLFCKTMSAVQKNIIHMCQKKDSAMWGPDGWKKITVVIVSDGRTKVHPRTLKVLGLMGCYQDGIAKDTVAGKPVTAHLFEYTTQVIVDDLGNVQAGGKLVPIQVLFCLKEKNAKKLNSHRWFFNAFCRQLRPNVTVLLDVGTKPSHNSIYHLWKTFDKDKGIGGACGEIYVDLGKRCSNLINPLVAAQNFEYKISNILDKPLESVFGYISVLPGAFSAYRYKALLNDPATGHGPLASYFKGEAMHGSAPGKASIFDANMYLAEDRILCFEIVTKKREAWTLRYVKNAKASTDAPSHLAEFISQRRRWLNGSFFAAVYATVHTGRIWTSGQGFLRKIVLQIEFIYQAIVLLFSFFAVGNFFLAFQFLGAAASQNPASDPFNGHATDVYTVASKIYLGVLFTIVVASMGNRPQGSRLLYWLCVLVFAVIMVLTVYSAAWTIALAVPHTAAGWKNVGALFKQAAFRDIFISLASSYIMWLLASLLHCEPWHMLTSLIQYLLAVPSFINILQSYAFCNTHDVSWGTKGDNGPSKDLGGATTVKKTDDGKAMVEVALPTQREDIDAQFEHMHKELSTRPKEVKVHRDAATKQADQWASFRTRLVLTWGIGNVVLVVFFTSPLFTKWVGMALSSVTGGTILVAPYLTFLFWANAGIAAVKFTGSTLYLVFRFFGH